MEKCEFCNNKEIFMPSSCYHLCSDCFQKYYDKNIESLNDRSSKIIKLRLEKKTYREIAKVFGISLERVRQIFYKCAKQVVHRLRKKKEKK